jgi:hypothetical protein
MNFVLQRLDYLEDCTPGVIVLPELLLASLERPWIAHPDGHPGGKLRESCIPPGMFRVVPHSSEKFPNTYALVNEKLGVYHQFRPVNQTWGRTAILFHAANRVTELLGCIAPGLRPGQIAGQEAVLDSRAAMDKLRAILGREETYVEIRPPAGTQETP